MLGVRVPSLDWGAFSHRLFLQAPSKQRKKEYKTETVRTRKKMGKCESIIELQYTCIWIKLGHVIMQNKTVFLTKGPCTSSNNGQFR